MEHTGKILTIIGIPTTLAGAGLIAYGYKNFEIVYEPYYDEFGEGWYISGFVVAGLGLVSMINGIIFHSIGKNKSREYRIRLDNYKPDSYYSPIRTGMTLTYRF